VVSCCADMGCATGPAGSWQQQLLCSTSLTTSRLFCTSWITMAKQKHAVQRKFEQQPTELCEVTMHLAHEVTVCLPC
jgi:hypothetical protein